MNGSVHGVAANEDDEFRAALNDGHFLVRRCGGCDSYDFPPAPACWRCGSTSYRWVEVPSGADGTVFTWTTCHRSFIEFADEVPYTVVVAALPAFGDVRVLARLRGDRVGIGEQVELVVAPGSYAWSRVR